MNDFRSESKRPQNKNVFEVEELLTSILLKLPVKSLIICKFVCKYWRNLICNPSFMSLQLIQSQENPSYIIYNYFVPDNNKHMLTKIDIDGETPQSFLLSCNGGFDYEGTICSFNGLVCCADYAKNKKFRINICNPATQENLLLPPAPSSKSPHSFGVSFTINDYKVFQFFYGKGLLYEYMVYSSITASWKSIGSSVLRPASSKHVCINGTVYWFCKSGLVAYILVVDWEENFSIIRIPKEETMYPFLVNLEGCLSMVFVGENGRFPFPNRFDIWVLEDSKESVWVKKLSDTIPISKINSIDYVAAVQGNEILFGNRRKYLLYNMDTQSWRESNWDYCRDGSFSDPMAYTESLLPCKRRIDL